MDDHIDKLLNYIRYWQASGESLKTSARTKTRLSQIVQEGRFRGGIVPYGYRLEKQGRFNKKNHEVNEILVDPDEAAVVRIIFEKYVYEGFGAQRLSRWLYNNGYLNRKGTRQYHHHQNAEEHHVCGNPAQWGNTLRNLSGATNCSAGSV